MFLVLYWCTTCMKKACVECFNTVHENHAFKNFRKHLQQNIQPSYDVTRDRILRLLEGARSLENRLQNAPADQSLVDASTRQLNRELFLLYFPPINPNSRIP